MPDGQPPYYLWNDATPVYAIATRRAHDLFKATNTPVTNEGLLQLARRVTTATRSHPQDLWEKALGLVVYDDLDTQAPYAVELYSFDDLRGLVASITVDRQSREDDLALLDGVPIPRDRLVSLCAGMVKLVWQETYGGGDAEGCGSTLLDDYDTILSPLWQEPVDHPTAPPEAT
ncbi:hypothetical protein ABZ234_08035 [Nocardiopsis sp. NPDC006198]|uniref:hypothetical protein n=1 Tax=Nocardiopsis sp. NPDC006198 TaxID=3154472 RepID=UPI0033AC58E4